jgi:H+/Cl- antiporter ClcA
MTIIYGPAKPVDYHPDARQLTAAYSASVVDFFEAGHRRSSESKGTGKEAEIAQGHRHAVYWLISLAALLSLLVGVLCLLEPVTPRTAGTDQLDLAAEGAPSHVEVTIGNAIQALSVRH